MSAGAKSAEVVEELVEYDGPQLLLLKTNRSKFMIAMAVGRHEEMANAFFGCELTDKVYESYFDQRADLHYAFVRAFGQSYYLFDYDKIDDGGHVVLTRVNDDHARDAALWPEVGFFARSHTTAFNRPSAAGDTQKFKIDGKWGTNDFSIFHGKMSDLYALFGVLARLNDPADQTEQGFIRATIKERFWQGGGSYVGFYDSLMARNKLLRLTPLEVARIQYASPGEIDLRGDPQALINITDIIDVFDEAWVDLAKQYTELRKSLAKERLLSAKPTAEFSSEHMKNFVQEKTVKFAEALRIEGVGNIFDACDQNTLVFAKVILSIFRRANELYKFHAEGRVQRAS
ncbi:hypothetical protein [Bradyrhizobium sp. SZCCHNR1039]|uniref:hypothetical protein n=1 Tax=Bradyrhizobium sp. SZCCHNR1039 TaxID=3057350 RepID=UPI0029165155|nr:hypothetical protein [Bradyrhizobium sp. SZCCHNR1039]